MLWLVALLCMAAAFGLGWWLSAISRESVVNYTSAPPAPDVAKTPAIPLEIPENRLGYVLIGADGEEKSRMTAQATEPAPFILKPHGHLPPTHYDYVAEMNGLHYYQERA